MARQIQMGHSSSQEDRPAAKEDPTPSPPAQPAVLPTLPTLTTTRGQPAPSELLPEPAIAPLHEAIGGSSSGWRLLYSTRLHGSSFGRLLKSAVGKGPTLTVVRECAADAAPGAVFGGWADSSWRTGSSFFGGGRCFLFRLPAEAAGAAGAEGKEVAPAEIFRARDPNRLYLNSKSNSHPTALAFGGQLYDFEGTGKHHTGFWALSIDESMSRGTSAETASYSNPVLAAHAKATDHSFTIDDIEVWSTDSEFELERAGGRQLGADDGGLALMLDAAGVAQHAKNAGIDDHRQGTGSLFSQPDKPKGETSEEWYEECHSAGGLDGAQRF